MGWWEQEPGIFVRWCARPAIGRSDRGSSYWLMEVWCKERSVVTSRPNEHREWLIVGWTSDTMYLSKGQKGVLTFQKYGLPGGGGAVQGRLVKFSTRTTKSQDPEQTQAAYGARAESGFAALIRGHFQRLALDKRSRVAGGEQLRCQCSFMKVIHVVIRGQRSKTVTYYH